MMKKTIFFISILIIIYFFMVLFNQADWDLWARLAVGALFFKTGSVLKHDIFAYTPTKELWVDHEWGSGVVFYFFSHYFGETGLIFVKFILLFLVFLFVFKLNQIKSNGENQYRIGYYSLFVFGLLFGFLDTIRSHCFTYMFFALWLYMLELVKRGNLRLVWCFPATMILWANLHGGFVAGLGIVFLYALGEFFNKKNPSVFLLILALSSVVTLINPYGFEYWVYLIDAISMTRPFITEWVSLDLFGNFQTAFLFKIFGLFTLFSLPYLFLKKAKEINWAEIFILAVTCYLSIKHIRHNVFFIIASASYTGNYLYSAFSWYFGKIIEKIKFIIPVLWRKIAKKSSEILIYSLIFLVGFLTIVFVPLKVKVDEYRFPVQAVNFIEKNDLSGNLLVLFNWGSYALWKLYPQCLVSVDGRYEEVYPNSVIYDVARFHYVGKNWEGLMNNYNTDLMLIDKSYAVYEKLVLLDDWKIIYQDKISAVFVPASKAEKDWKSPDSLLEIEKEKFKTRIFN